MTSEYNRKAVLRIIKDGDCSITYITWCLKKHESIVYSAINELKDLGYDIVTNRGVVRLQS